MIFVFSIATWNALTFSYIVTGRLSLETSTWARLQKKDCFTHRLEHPITQVPRYGAINPMILSRIFGLLGASFMKCVPWCHLSAQRTWTACSKKCWKANSHRYPRTIAWTWGRSSRVCWMLQRDRDLTQPIFCTCPSAKSASENTFLPKTVRSPLWWLTIQLLLRTQICFER